jgi:hypothetical protein
MSVECTAVECTAVVMSVECTAVECTAVVMSVECTADVVTSRQKMHYLAALPEASCRTPYPDLRVDHWHPARQLVRSLKTLPGQPAGDMTSFSTPGQQMFVGLSAAAGKEPRPPPAANIQHITHCQSHQSMSVVHMMCQLLHHVPFHPTPPAGASLVSHPLGRGPLYCCPALP